MERDEARAARLEARALNAAAVMPEADSNRLRVEPNSDYILKLEAAYRQARRDLKLRLADKGSSKTAKSRNKPSVWSLGFDLQLNLARSFSKRCQDLGRDNVV